MADFTLSPNMSMPVPTVAEAPGPGWATNIDASLSIVDQHNHSAGQGVQITPAGINISTDLPFNNNNATGIRSVNFQSQATPLSTAVDLGCLYVSGVDLYYNDENGNQIRITQSGSVVGSSGTITGLPSGTASASFSAATFTFQSATNTPASMAVGPLIIGNNVANSKTVTVQPNSGISNNYNLTLPAALPAGVNYVTLDNSGNLNYNSSGLTGSGAVVLATSPTLVTPNVPSGIVFTSGTLSDYMEGTYIPSFFTTSGSGTPSLAAPVAGFQMIGNTVYVRMTLVMPSTVLQFNFSLPVLPIATFSNADQLLGSLLMAETGQTGVGRALIDIGTRQGVMTWRTTGGTFTANANAFIMYTLN